MAPDKMLPYYEKNAPPRNQQQLKATVFLFYYLQEISLIGQVLLDISSAISAARTCAFDDGEF